MGTTKSSRVVIALTVLSSLALTSCSAGTETPADAYQTQFQTARASTSSQYVLDALEDGTIAPEEYRDSQSQYVTCLSDAGIEASYVANNAGYESLIVSTEMTAELSTADRECFDQWVGPIEELYVAQLINPQNRDMSGLIAQCLVRKDLAPAGFTGRDYDDLLESQPQEQVGSGEQVIIEGDADIIIPGGSSLSEPAAVLCQLNPQK